MSHLSDFRLLSFDVYGTLIDWETGVIEALQPSLDANNASFSREHLLQTYSEFEKAQQTKTPGMKYSELVATIHPHIAERLGFPEPPAERNRAFGESVGQWPAFPDTVGALKRLGKFYKLVVLSNVDIESFAQSNAGPLGGVKFDLVITAQEFGVKKAEVLQTAQSQFHDHRPAKKHGIKSSWICRPGAVMGQLDEVVYDWKFDTLKDMADALDVELAGS
ncbi:hypothetical protein G7046_g4002 [Stylonectria norvegica]|nr:hypothetical protein G7046_g4002 [Stylonectria norvegica]